METRRFSVSEHGFSGKLPALMANFLESVVSELAALSVAGLRRHLRTVETAQRAEIILEGRRVINFSGNNYLGLADHPALTRAAEAAMAEYGFGAGASRLIVGSLRPHRELEELVARWKHTEAALLFNSGYQANVGVVSALANPGDLVVSDELNHASMIDGCRLARATVRVFRHADAEHAAELASGPARRRLLLTESVFSMDGDRAPLETLAAVAERHGALLVIDEAHAVGVLGADGAGIATGLDGALQIGTFSKALGGFGAYVAGKRQILELLVQRARSFVFSTALPVPVVAAAAAAVRWLETEEGRERRARLTRNAELCHRALGALGFQTGLPSHIVPLRARGGEPEVAMQASQALLERGIFAHGIRPPTVPGGTSRIRLSLMATHTDDHLARLSSALAELRGLFA